jgi:hypothetical protein
MMMMMMMKSNLSSSLSYPPLSFFLYQTIKNDCLAKLLTSLNDIQVFFWFGLVVMNSRWGEPT